MELVVLFVILVLLIFGPRKGGRMPLRIAIPAGALFLLWMFAAFGLSAIWKAVIGPVVHP